MDNVFMCCELISIIIEMEMLSPMEFSPPTASDVFGMTASDVDCDANFVNMTKFRLNDDTWS